MSKQINFYLTLSDSAELEAKMRELGPFLILHSRSSDSRPRILDSLEHEENGVPWLYFYLCRKEDLNGVVMREVPSQKYWGIDVIKSPVIEFHKSTQSRDVLKRGRAYYIESFFDESDVAIEKSEEFLFWAKSVFNVIKRNLKKLDGDYIGRDAKEWLSSSGGKLAFM